MVSGTNRSLLWQIARVVLSAVLIFLLLALAAVKGRAAVINADPSNYKGLVAGLKPGDTLNLAAGTYPLLSLRDLNGTAAAWITIQGPASGAPATVTVNPANPACCNLVQLGNTSYVAIRNLRVDSALVDAIDGVNSSGITHNILVENCTFVGQGSHQQTVAISTKGTAWNWTIRGNSITEAGTGMYLGNSTGDSPFIAGVIENNLMVDTIGYNVQIKWQRPYTAPAGLPAGPNRTIIRNNVFIKNKAQSAWRTDQVDGARPNLLVGGYPTSGTGANDTYEIYGNFFYENKDGEALVQGSGWVSLHDNVFVGGSYRAINLINHDLPIRRGYVYNNTIYGQVRGVTVSGSSLEDSLVTGNLILANEGVNAPVQKDNIVDTAASAANHVVQPSLVLGSMNFYPKTGQAKGAPLDMSKFTSHVQFNVDFNGTSKGSFIYRGAYAGEGTNPGWALTAAKKPLGAPPPPPPGGGDTTPPARPQGLRVR
jgi:hypothetical protein